MQLLVKRVDWVNPSLQQEYRYFFWRAEISPKMRKIKISGPYGRRKWIFQRLLLLVLGLLSCVVNFWQLNEEKCKYAHWERATQAIPADIIIKLMSVWWARHNMGRIQYRTFRKEFSRDAQPAKKHHSHNSTNQYEWFIKMKREKSEIPKNRSSRRHGCNDIAHINLFSYFTVSK